ncbi:uncharacterized protein DS421_6g176850 [Arachis hypogaea]|nr:uncharacterized protein DS421_6g176850 [Arachis hypogaea]
MDISFLLSFHFYNIQLSHFDLASLVLCQPDYFEMKMKTMTTTITSLLALIMLLNNEFMVLGSRQNLLEHKFSNKFFLEEADPSPKGEGHDAPGHKGPPPTQNFQKQTHEFSIEGSGPSDGGEGHKLPPSHGGPPHS